MSDRVAGSRLQRVVGAVDPALGLLAAIGFVSQVGISVMLPLLPLYATELGAPPIVLGLLTSAFAVTNAFGQLGAGFLSERWGARRLMTAGLALYGTMNALIATAATAAWLLTWRTTAGLGGGAMIVSERIYLAQSIEPARRAFANGIISRGAVGRDGRRPGVRRLRRGDRRAARAVRDRRGDERRRPGRHALPARPRARTQLRRDR